LLVRDSNAKNPVGFLRGGTSPIIDVISLSPPFSLVLKNFFRRGNFLNKLFFFENLGEEIWKKKNFLSGIFFKIPLQKISERNFCQKKKGGIANKYYRVFFKIPLREFFFPVQEFFMISKKNNLFRNFLYRNFVVKIFSQISFFKLTTFLATHGHQTVFFR